MAKEKKRAGRKNDIALIKGIQRVLSKAGRKGLTQRELAAALKMKKDEAALSAALKKALAEGSVIQKKGRYLLAESRDLHPALVLPLHRTYGFGRLEKEDRDVFLPGSRLHGALPGDRVLLQLTPGRDGQLDTGEVVSILQQGNPEFIGTIRLMDGQPMAEVEQFGDLLPVTGSLGSAREGDRVIVRVLREENREDRAPAVAISAVYGPASLASSCAAALLDQAGITPDFPMAVMDEARFLEHRGISAAETAGRTDFRALPIFTIDGADSKDLDDAIHLEKRPDGWLLGVHIADVSHYVRAGSNLDNEAFRRGTSIYYADRVIPMLPRELSNGICSLNPGEDRLAFSALLTLTPDGQLKEWKFCKSVICSRVKGVYGEVNQLLDGSTDPALTEKYAAVLNELANIRELGRILKANQLKRGAPVIDSAESKIILGEDGRTADIQPRHRGEAEEIIEVFMIAANEAAARMAREAGIPFVYRVHESPSPEKVEALRILLKALGQDASALKKDTIPVSALSQVLQQTADSPSRLAVHRQVLRTMMKAQYSEHPTGHYGLALADYCHFTSPIRRYPDLAIHRILTDLIEEYQPADYIQRRYRVFTVRAAAHSSETELAAMDVERSCEDCYKAEYMQDRVGEVFDATISGVASYGFYVALENTVEGLVHLTALPEGQYLCDDIALTNTVSGRRYRIGDHLRVKCLAADVSGGKIDFGLETAQ